MVIIRYSIGFKRDRHSASAVENLTCTLKSLKLVLIFEALFSNYYNSDFETKNFECFIAFHGHTWF